MIVIPNYEGVYLNGQVGNSGMFTPAADGVQVRVLRGPSGHYLLVVQYTSTLTKFHNNLFLFI